jgi:hypothetical protein
MTKYMKSPDTILDVVDPKGRARKVTRRAFDVVYKAQGYKMAEAKEENPGSLSIERTDGSLDFFMMTREELEKVKNDDLKAFLDDENIEYKSDDNKKELISLILGE